MLIVTNAPILRRYEGCDHISLLTTLPCDWSGEQLSLEFNVPRGRAEAYLAENFPGVPVELIAQNKMAAYKFRR